MTGTTVSHHDLAYDVRMHVFQQAAATGRVPQPRQIAAALDRPLEQVEDALRVLAAGKVIILAPNSTNIWTAAPFCAVPSGFRVVARDTTYWGICIWDALGIAAALGADASITTGCGDCGEPMSLAVRAGALTQSQGVIHFAVPARYWWDNIGFS